ncbi:MAG: amidohydrolase family protein [Xanthomonadales bacterium]
MTRSLLAALAISAFTSGTFASEPVPRESLLTPPEDATRYVIVSDTNTHGNEWRWETEDGEIAFRKSQTLRGWITETDALVVMGYDGKPLRIRIRGVTPEGNAAEEMVTDENGIRWDSGADTGTAPPDGGFYLTKGGPNTMFGMLVEYMLDKGEVQLLPTGTARLRDGGTLAIEDEDGDLEARLVFIEGLQPAPTPVWVDDKGRHLASIRGMGLIREGYQEHFKAMRQMQEEASRQAATSVARRFLTEDARRPLLVDNVRLFDAEAGRFIENQAVGRGKTLVPGLWDSHKHFGDGYDLLANVATGMTSIRSPGNALDKLLWAKEARAAGNLLAPEVFGAIIIDQDHPLSAQGASLVSSEEETLAAVRKAADAGLWGVKFYTSMNPEWIAPAAAEAHRLGLHVLGHVPATMRPLEAVRAGYDEVTHVNFIIMQALPQDVVDVSNTAARFEGPARYAKDVDLEGPVMTGFVAELKQRGTWVDPTIVIFEGFFLNDAPKLPPAIAPYEGTLPAVLERGLKTGGYPLFGDVTRDDFRKAYEKMVALIGKLNAAHVPIVAGTDGMGLELVREIEIYEQAGLSKAQALQTATINPARLVGIADRTGSIAKGKEADMLLVNGDVSADLGALRHVHTVISDGYVMDGDKLRAAAGFSGMPR